VKKSLGAQTLVQPVPVWIIGTYDEAGRPNIMTAAWAGICCSQPPCVSVSLRKATYTYGNIVARKCFTVNVPSAEQAKAADYLGMVSGRDTDKFAGAGLTPVKSELVDAPWVREFPMVIECSLIHSLEIGLHTLFVGRIMDVKADEEVLDGQGHPDMERVSPVVYSPGARTYYRVGQLIGPAFSIGKDL